MTQAQTGTTLPYRQTIPVERLRPNDDNPRQDPGQISDLDLKELKIPELKRSIQAAGLKQPLLVYPDPDRADHWIIEDGWRRWLALRDWKTDIPCIVQPPMAGENQHVRNIITALTTAENRLDLNPIQKAYALSRLQSEFGLTTQAQIAELTGMSITAVSNSLALLELSEDSQKRVAKGTLSVTDAMRAIKRRRRINRRKKGGTGLMGPVWETAWFTRQHPLARKALALCDSRDHSSRRRYGAGTGYEGACGECWQNVIEKDYELVLLAAGWQPPPARVNDHAGT